MHAQYSVVDYRADWQYVEAGAELSPQPDAVPSFALVVETIDSVNLTALMVTSKQEEIFLELDLVS